MKNDRTTAEMIVKVIELIDKKNITEFYHLVKTINAYSRKKCEPELSNLVVIYAPYFDCYIKSRKHCFRKGVIS